MPTDATCAGGAPETALLVRGSQAAAMCGQSLRTWRAWDAAGLVPRPLRIARSVLWRADEIQAWIAAGCPPRAAWQWRW